jgi:formylglycine-generating enzyme required for sulfatase activity
MDWSASDPDALRRAGAELLSLALIDSRNRLLALFALDDEAAFARRTALEAAWFQEWWIARHVQRQRGEACDANAPRLASIEPRLDDWHGGPDAALPDAPTVRALMAATLETTLELLAMVGDDGDAAALHVYRNALLHEDRLGERLAQALRPAAPPARVEREPVWLPARRWRLGSEPDAGFTPHNERWAHEVAVPEFEIDAQPVSWARYVEFAADGGYDRRELWSDAGWAWAVAQERRAPRHVEQMQGAVLLQGRDERAGLKRAAAGQPAMHLSRHEAEAWCRWAGRRLPTEPEWEQAATLATSRGFVWGDVFEWVAGSARAWPGAPPAAPGCLDPIPPAQAQAVLRGASFASAPRQRHPKARRFAPADADTMFCGFRSCAL